MVFAVDRLAMSSMLDRVVADRVDAVDGCVPYGKPPNLPPRYQDVCRFMPFQRALRRTGFGLVVLLTLTSVAAAAPEPDGKPMVREIQRDLKELGYKVPIVDGLYGPVTRGAIEAFQTDRGLDVTGEATRKLQRRLDRILFMRSEEARRLWRQSRLHLKALGYSPGEGGMDSRQARRALKTFARTYWVDVGRGFSRTLHDLIRRRLRQSPSAHLWLCENHMSDGAYSLALGWCRRAARRDHPVAQYYMGWMAYYGRGRQPSDTDAFKWFHAAARAGEKRAQVFTGLMYRQGRGVGRDPAAAILWYQKATDQGASR
jgi:TPR repeat protein